MEKELNLRDTREYNCLSYGAYVASTEKISVRIVGCREEGEFEYCRVDLHESSSLMKLYERSILTLMEPLKLYFEIETEREPEFQLTTDTISTGKGKAVVAYTIAVWDEKETGVKLFFNLTAWKKEIK